MRLFENRFIHRVLHKTSWLALLPLCALWGGLQAGSASTAPEHTATPELPTHWAGSTWRPLALGEVEQRLAQHFPGSVTRLTDGAQVMVLRTVERPTRMLHPAADCYRGLGYRISAEHLQQRPDGALWRCFQARRDGQTLHVCEHIEDPAGRSYTDASAWYWAAVLGQTQGPWRATTVAHAELE